ncbi:hypothetical protein [Kordiimonas sp.]|uniref:hypothetical protein n=1 Tax=Kordiimonas sp. TaxID=1970157 RepID=UPI003A8D479A
MNVYFSSAAVVTAVTCFIHCWFGGKYIAEPLLRARDLHTVPKYTNYYCWHMVSIVLAAMSGAYFWASVKPDAVELAVVSFGLSAAFCIWNVVLIVWKKQRFQELPQWSLFAAGAMLGGIGLAL